MLDKYKDLFEKYIILAFLEKNNWNKTKTAKELDISRQALDLKIKKYGLTKSSPIPDPKNFLIEIPEEKKRFFPITFSIPEDELESLKILVKNINRLSKRRISTSEIIRLALDLLTEKDLNEIYDLLKNKF